LTRSTPAFTAPQSLWPNDQGISLEPETLRNSIFAKDIGINEVAATPGIEISQALVKKSPPQVCGESITTKHDRVGCLSQGGYGFYIA